MIADIMTNKRFQAIIKELFIRSRKLNISLVFITQCFFPVPKDIRLNSTHYFIMKINNRKELQNIAISHSADIDYKGKELYGKDLSLKPSTIEQAKFEYSPLGKVFTEGLNKDDQKDGLFKRLKSIEDKNEELLKIKKIRQKT